MPLGLILTALFHYVNRINGETTFGVKKNRMKVSLCRMPLFSVSYVVNFSRSIYNITNGPFVDVVTLQNFAIM